MFDGHPGDLICVIGSVGSGKVWKFSWTRIFIEISLKSSLLQALTGEISFFDGHVRLHGSVCYVPQESCKNLVIKIIELLWIDSGIFSSTIKKNILFSNDYDQQLFERVVQATALDLVI